jgi:guanylate kinase
VTTRDPRDGEVKGKSYVYVSLDTFESLRQQEKLLEWAQFGDHCYGTPAEFVDENMADGFDVVLTIDVQGGFQVKNVFPTAVLIFILPPSLEVLRDRIEKRGDLTKDEVEKRIEIAKEEIAAAERYDYFVINDVLDAATNELGSIISAERCLRGRHPEKFIEDFLKE